MKKVKSLLGAIVVVLIFGYLVRIIVVNWHQVKGFEWKFNIPFLLFSFLLFASTQLFAVWVWRRLIGAFGYSLRFDRLFVIWWIAAMGRYLPGKVWQLVGLAVLGEREGIPAEVTTAASIMTQALSILSGFIIAVPILIVEKNNSLIPILLFVLVLAVATYPPVFRKWVNFIGRKIRGIEINVFLTPLQLLIFVLLYAAMWLGYGLGFALFVSGITGRGITLDYISIYAFSYIIGLITIFVPGGFGVREGVMTAFLTVRFGAAVASAVSIAARLWVTLVEVIFFVIALAMSGRRKKHELQGGSGN